MPSGTVVRGAWRWGEQCREDLALGGTVPRGGERWWGQRRGQETAEFDSAEGSTEYLRAGRAHCRKQGGIGLQESDGGSAQQPSPFIDK